MSDINSIVLVGNVGKEPEVLTFENDVKLTKFTMAVKRYDRKAKEDVTDWFDIETFSKLGEYVKKGIKICVEGSLETNTWTNKEGKNIKSYAIKARNLQILTPKKEEQKQETDYDDIIGV